MMDDLDDLDDPDTLELSTPSGLVCAQNNYEMGGEVDVRGKIITVPTAVYFHAQKPKKNSKNSKNSQKNLIY